jgi:hypothetical protein
MTKLTRSFPEAREFLLSDVTGPDYPVKHLIEQARNKGHITRGKQGRGGGVVTSRDMSILLAGTLAGDTPQAATDAMPKLSILVPFVDFFGAKPPSIEGLSDNWWDCSFVDVITNLIDAWRTGNLFSGPYIRLSLNRTPPLSARVSWSTEPYEQEEYILYHFRDNDVLPMANVGQRKTSASYDCNALMLVGDWLEGRESF